MFGFHMPNITIFSNLAVLLESTELPDRMRWAYNILSLILCEMLYNALPFELDGLPTASIAP